MLAYLLLLVAFVRGSVASRAELVAETSCCASSSPS
jgi:hypothetical protein